MRQVAYELSLGYSGTSCLVVGIHMACQHEELQETDMRIVGGKWAGKNLVSPGGRVRPTAENVRDRWLTMLEPDLDGASILDLFSGSGALGLEALSRGAVKVDFVENGPSSLHSLKANVARFPIKRRARIFKQDAIPFVERLPVEVYDIAFADPPYGSRKLDRVVKRWLDVPFCRILCVEHAQEHKLSRKGKRYDLGGETRVTVFRAQ
jgi:16S rRNA (guanine966-N2)-methyltransferase